MNNPIHMVRRLTSLSILATTESVPELCSLAEHMSQSIFTEIKANALHTQLLTLLEMVQQLRREKDRHPCAESSLKALNDLLNGRAVDFLNSQRCDVLRSAFLDVLSLFSSPCSPALEHCLLSILNASLSQMPGEAALLLNCTNLLCTMSSYDSLYTLLDAPLSMELKVQLISHLTCSYQSVEHLEQLQGWLVDCLLTTPSTYYKECLLGVLLRSFKQIFRVEKQKMSQLLTVIDKASPSYAVIAMYARQSLGTTESLQVLFLSCHDSAAHAECVAVIVNLYKEPNLTAEDKIQLLTALLTLLHDECAEIRVAAAQSSVLLLTKVSQERGVSVTLPPDDLHSDLAKFTVLMDLPKAMALPDQMWMEWLQSIILDNLNHLIQTYQAAKEAGMFFQEEDNVYHDRSVFVGRVCAVIQKAKDSGIVTNFRPYNKSLDSTTVQLRGLVQSFDEVKCAYNKLSSC
ncbi:uncharacterized protein [Watersipora subatra]|uniref:uncharacterized protein n=1 Tax=Watersipora subatra TaxID=2589382 RepID=UPI00355B59B0